MKSKRQTISILHSLFSRNAGRLLTVCILASTILQAKAANILFLVANTTLLPGDAAAKTLMESMGHVVNVKLGTASVTGDAAANNLVVVSSTINSADVGAKFKTVTQPVISWEASIFDDMGMTGTVSGTDYGTTAALSTLVMQNSTHQLSAGLTGTPAVTTATRTQNFGKPAAAAIKIANQVGDATKIAIFGYDVGAAMVGLNAPGRRVGFFMIDDSPNALTTQGTNLFKAAINWALGINPPTISTQPAAATVTAPGTATFSVVAAGTAPLSYQWRKGGVNISGATAASYTTPATTTADNGALFSVAVTNAAGTATSVNATLTVNAGVAPAINTQPASATVTAPATATFSVVASGTAPLAYQWRKGGVNISGATSASYTTPATALADNGALFSVVVSNAAGSATSASATLTVNGPPVAPTITAQPANQTVVLGQSGTFTVTAGGTAPLSYQWRKGGVDISGATAASYTTPATVAGDNGAAYSVLVTNSAGSATSAIATLTVNIPPTISTQPANQSAAVGATATFTVAAAGTSPFTYQWRKNAVAITGATSATYVTPAVAATDDGAQYSVVVTNPAGSVTSSAASLAVFNAPVITSQPANVSVTVGQAASFNVVASGSPAPSYQWRRNGATIPGATAANYAIAAATAADNGASFSVVVSNSAGSVTSSGAILTVGPRPTTQTVSLSGELFDNANIPVGQGAGVQRDITVRVYGAQTGGTALYTETFLTANSQSVLVQDGLFTLRLGTGTTSDNLQAIVSGNANLYAEFLIGTPGAQELIQPRMPVTAPLLAGTPRVVLGTDSPTAVEAVGTYYRNTTDNSLWVRMSDGWIRISP